MKRKIILPIRRFETWEDAFYFVRMIKGYPYPCEVNGEVLKLYPSGRSEKTEREKHAHKD